MACPWRELVGSRVGARRGATTFSVSRAGEREGWEGPALVSLQRRPRPQVASREASGRQAGVKGVLLATLFLVASPAHAQLLSDLEPERPISIEDARPVSYRALSGSADWTFNKRLADLDDYGPGFSLTYGAAWGLEVGAGVRWVTRPGRNAERGISSGDLVLHALYGLTTETAKTPALAVRVGVRLPTGLDSKGTDLLVAGLLTRSFDTFRLHGNLRWTRVGETFVTERPNRFEAIAGLDFVPSRQGLTDSLIVGDLVVRSNPVRGGRTIIAVELGARQRVGTQTFLFVGAGSEVFGEDDRARLRLRGGFTHVY